MAESTTNLVSFRTAAEGGQRVFLDLEGDFVFRVGMAPNVNRARISYGEFAKLEPYIDSPGLLEFWFNSNPLQGTPNPDHTIFGVRVVEVMPGTIGVLQGQSKGRPIDYTLYLADGRAAFSQPFGGRLNEGLVNADAREGSVAASPVVPFNTLVEMCAKRMGLASIAMTGVSAPPPKNLRWFNAHAPTEMGKLLEPAGAVFVPDNDGKFSVVKAGAGAVPSIPATRLESDVAAASPSRRAKTLILCSSPSATIDTLKIRGPAGGSSPASVVFVIQDVDGTWKPINSTEIATNYWSGSTAQAQVRSRFASVSERYRETVRQQAYRFFRLDAATYDPTVQRILRRKLGTDSATGATLLQEIEVYAKRANLQQSHLWRNSEERIRCTAAFLIGTNNIICTHERLGTLEGEADVADWESKFVEPAVDDVEIKFSIEAALASPSTGKKIPDYAYFGFTLGPQGQLQVLTEGTARAEADQPGPQTIIIDRPELRRIRDDINTTDNLPQLKAAALEIAQKYFDGVTRLSRIMTASGFFPVSLNGKTVEVRYNQQQARTTIITDGLDSALMPRSKSGAGGGGGGRDAGDQQSDPLALGAGGGGVQPIVPLNPSFAPLPPAGRIVIKAKSNSQINNYKRWVYKVREQEKKLPGSLGAWQDKPGAVDRDAYNLLEANNDSSGLMGNGVTLAGGGFVAGTKFTIQPLPNGWPVEAFEVATKDAEGKPITELWFSYENGIDGACE
jgi:hypothetical protein